jgi:hypothetical protein
MLADPTFADLVHSIGVASLGADDKTIRHLTKVSSHLNIGQHVSTPKPHYSPFSKHERGLVRVAVFPVSMLGSVC